MEMCTETVVRLVIGTLMIAMSLLIVCLLWEEE